MRNMWPPELTKDQKDITFFNFFIKKIFIYTLCKLSLKKEKIGLLRANIPEKTNCSILKVKVNLSPGGEFTVCLRKLVFGTCENKEFADYGKIGSMVPCESCWEKVN